MPERETLGSSPPPGARWPCSCRRHDPPRCKQRALGPAQRLRGPNPGCIVVRASWPDEQVVPTTIGNLADDLVATGATTTVLVLVGPALAGTAPASHLYSPTFAHKLRKRSRGRDDRRTGGGTKPQHPGRAERVARFACVRARITAMTGETNEPELSPDVAERQTGLRTGWTTGTCASAAAKAAAMRSGHRPRAHEVEVGLPKGARVSFPSSAPDGWATMPTPAGGRGQGRR